MADGGDEDTCATSKSISVGNKVHERVHHLKEELASCKQGGQSVTEYYGRLAKMWEELDVYEKERDEEKVHQFVMGLDQSRFGAVCQEIIVSSDDLGEAYAKVIREEQRLLTSSNQLQHSWMLPTDLMVDVFSRLSLKSIAICRCVSKQWASVVAHPDFRGLLLTRSRARPRILFAYMPYEYHDEPDEDMVIFLSIPQPQSLDEISSSPVTADCHMTFSFGQFVEELSSSVSGLFCRATQDMAEESVICNPSTGQSLTLPRMRRRPFTMLGVRRLFLFGYDPVEEVHKVLAMLSHRKERMADHQVLTLGGGGGGTEKATWRIIKRGIPCFPPSYEPNHNICINGVLYYLGLDCDRVVICFHVRSEKFSFIKFPEPLSSDTQLLDFNGKLAVTVRGENCLTRTSQSIELCVLQDPQRHEWSRHVYIFPPMWNDVVYPDDVLKIVGVTGPDEFVMASELPSDPFHVYYCNFEKRSAKRVAIQGMGELYAFGTSEYVHTNLNHVEDVKLLKL